MSQINRNSLDEYTTGFDFNNASFKLTYVRLDVSRKWSWPKAFCMSAVVTKDLLGQAIPGKLFISGSVAAAAGHNFRHRQNRCDVDQWSINFLEFPLFF